MRKLILALFAAVVGISTWAQSSEPKTGVDDEGFIRNWLVLASIPVGEKANVHEEDAQKTIYDKEYFANQSKVMPKAGDKVKAEGKELEWKAVESSDSIVNILELCKSINSAADFCIAMGVCYITADSEMSGLKLKIGSDDGSKWILNDAEVIRIYSGRPTEKDQDSSETVTLKKGVNVLRFLCINGESEFGICARFVDKDDKPVKNIKISLTPPAVK